MLIGLLWESLDEERVKEIEAKWAAESEDRMLFEIFVRL